MSKSTHWTETGITRFSCSQNQAENGNAFRPKAKMNTILDKAETYVHNFTVAHT